MPMCIRKRPNHSSAVRQNMRMLKSTLTSRSAIDSSPKPKKSPAISTLHRACIANDVVEIFLKPAKTPYEGQYLPEDEASHERQRCEAVKNRIAELRSKIATPSAGSTVQKSGKQSLFGVRAMGTTPA